MHRHLKSIATWWEGVFSKDSRVFPPPNPLKAKLEFSTSMLTPTLPITPFKPTCTCWQSPDLDMVLVLIPDLYPESDLLLDPTTWCDWWLKHKWISSWIQKIPWVKRLCLGLLCYASCHVTWPMLCNQHKYLKTCVVHPSLITVLSATIEVNVTQVFCHHQNLHCMLLHCLHLQKSNLSLSLSWDHYKIRCCWSNPGQHCYGQLGGNFQVEYGPFLGPSTQQPEQSHSWCLMCQADF